MNNTIRFTDAITGHVHLADKAGKKYIKTKDSDSPSGHSIIAQIEMTHSGIVTKNYGFYLPCNMRDGAPTFNQDYNKPVLIGHDTDTDPVGRVIASRYVDTMQQLVMNDKYLSAFQNFHDKKSEKQSNQLLDFVQYVVSEYAFKDSYKGLGHILGTLKISDAETIEKILDERFLTVSTAMTSDAARCSECGQDWISEGMCEHVRGQIYDSGIPMVIVPGRQEYSHVGIVSEPADVFAAGFKGIEIIKDNVSKKLDIVDKEFSDKFSITANLFSYKNNSLISLSDETKTNLIEVKDNIQEIENSLKMENVNMKKFTDTIEATISLWKTSEDEGTTAVRISKYINELSPEQLAELSKKAMAALDSKTFDSEAEFKDALAEFILSEIPNEKSDPKKEVNDSTKNQETPEEGEGAEEERKVMDNVKILNEKFKIEKGAEFDASLEDKILGEINEIKDTDLTKKEAKELAKLIVRSQNGDVLAKLTLDATDKELKDSLAAYKELKDKRFKLAETSEEEVLEKMNELLDEKEKVSPEKFTELTSKDCAGTRKYFPITDAKVADAAKEVLGMAIVADSLKGRILGNIEKLKTTFSNNMEDSAETNEENFDTSSSECDNQLELSDEKLLEDLQGLLKEADDRDILGETLSVYLIEKDHEIGILEQQLELANDEIVKLEEQVEGFKDQAKKTLAEHVVDAKIQRGWISKDNRKKELEEHLERTEDSLNDMMKDLEKIEVNVKTTKTEDLEPIDNPVLQDSSTSASEQVFDDEVDSVKKKREKELIRKYNTIKATSGLTSADRWLAKQQITN